MSTPAPSSARAEIVVDLDAVRHNVATLRDAVGGRALMAVVKADGYGHGMTEVARPPGRPVPSGSGSRSWRRPSRCAPPATPAGC